MRRTWPFVVAVAAISGIAGFVVAGKPEPADTFIIDGTSTTTTTTTAPSELTIATDQP